MKRLGSSPQQLWRFCARLLQPCCQRLHAGYASQHTLVAERQANHQTRLPRRSGQGQIKLAGIIQIPHTQNHGAKAQARGHIHHAIRPIEHAVKNQTIKAWPQHRQIRCNARLVGARGLALMDLNLRRLIRHKAPLRHGS